MRRKCGKRGNRGWTLDLNRAAAAGMGKGLRQGILPFAGTIDGVKTPPGPTPSRETDWSTPDWGACLRAHEGWLRKVILARTGEPQAVDEVFQRVALAAVEQRSRLADPAKLAPWLHRIAVVQSCRYRRKLGRERKAVHRLAARKLSLENGYANDVFSLLLSTEREERVRHAMLQLAGGDAEILMLKYAERWSYRQIAQHLGITEKAVDARLLRARARLRQELINLGIDG
jgi:RNA polymerase sigma-70 factor (ECF subfamily)